MDVNSKKKTNAVSGSDIDEELEGCLEDLEDIANEIIASSDSECEQKIHKEVNEEKQEYNKDDIKVKEEDNKPNQTVPYQPVDNDLVQSIKKYIQKLVKVKNETIESLAASASMSTEADASHLNSSKLDSKSTEQSLNQFNDMEICSDGELVSDGSISNRSSKNKYEMIEGTEIISENSEWDNLESGECSSSEEILHKLCNDDAEYLSDATTVMGEDKSQIKKSVQEYYKKSEDCFLSFYNKIKHDLIIEGAKSTIDCNSFKNKLYSNSDNSIKKMCKITSHDDYNKAKLILREFKRKISQYKKSHRQTDFGHVSKNIGNEVLMEIVNNFDSHMSQESYKRLSDDLKNRLARLKRNVKRYERKVGLRKKEPRKKSKTINDPARTNSDNIDRRESKYNQDITKKSPEKSTRTVHDLQLSYKNIDGRKLRYSLDKAKRSPEKATKNKYYESHHNQEKHSSRRDSTTSNEKHNKEKLKVSEKVVDRSNVSEKRANKKITVLSYLEDCEQSINDNNFSKKETKSETNIFKKQLENLENKNREKDNREKKLPSAIGLCKQTDKKNMDPNYDNGELFITYSELIKNENKNYNERRKEEKSKEAKDVSVFAMTLSSEYGKHSSVIPFLQDEADACNTKIHTKELNQSQKVITSECGARKNVLDGYRSTGCEKTKQQSDVLSNPIPGIESRTLRSISTSPLRTSSRSRSNSLTKFPLEKEKYSRRSRSRSNSLSRIAAERGRHSRWSRSRSPNVGIEKERFSKSLKTTPYAYRRRRSRSHSRTRHYKKFRSPSPQFRKRYRSRSRSRRPKKSKKNWRKYTSSSSEERDVIQPNRTPPRSRKTPTKSFGDELRRKLKEENEKALALLKLTLAAQDKGQVTSTELVPFTSSSEEQRKDGTYKQPAEPAEGICEEITTSKEKKTEYEDQVSSINLSVYKLSELDCFHQTDSSNEKSEASSSSKTEPAQSKPATQPASLTPPLIPLPPLPPNEPQPAPPLPENTNDVKVVATYTSYVPMPCPSQPPPPNYMHPPSNDMYMPYMNPDMHHHPHPHPYMYPPPGYQMGNDPSMYHQPPPPPPHMMGHPQNSYGPHPFPYMHNTYPVAMPPYQNTPYQPPVMPPNFTCHQNIVTMTNEPIVKKTAPSGPILMEIGSDSDNSVYSPVLPRNPTIQEAIQFVKHKMLKDDIKKAINETKTGVDSAKTEETENIKEAKKIEDEPKKFEENKHESSNKITSGSKIIEDSGKINLRKTKPIKFSLQPKSRPLVVPSLNKSDVLGNSDNDCENIRVPQTPPKKLSKEQANEQSVSDNTVATNQVVIEKGPVIYPNVLCRTPVKNDGTNKKPSQHISKIKDGETESETKSDLKIIEMKENNVSKKTEDSEVQKKDHKNVSSMKSSGKELNDRKNKSKTESTQNNVKITTVEQEDMGTSEGCALEELKSQQFKDVNSVKTESPSDEDLQITNYTVKTANGTFKSIHKNEIKCSISEKQIKLKEPVEQMKNTDEVELVCDNKSTELENDEKGESRMETVVCKTDKTPEAQLKSVETNTNKSPVVNTDSEKQDSDINNKTSSVKRTVDKKHKEEPDKYVFCQMESDVRTIVSSKKESQEKLKVKFTEDYKNKCSELKHSMKEEAEPQRQHVSVTPENIQYIEMNEKEKIVDKTKHTSQKSGVCEINEDVEINICKQDVSISDIQDSHISTKTDKMVTPVSKLNKGSSPPKKMVNQTEALHMHITGTVCDTSELTKDKKENTKKDASVCGNKNIENKGPTTEVSLCKDRVESKLTSNCMLKESNSNKEDTLSTPGEPESSNIVLQNEDLETQKTSTLRSHRNRNKKHSTLGRYKKSDKLEDSVKDGETEMSDNFIHRSNSTKAEKCKPLGTPLQKETVKQAPVNETDAVIENQGKSVTCIRNKTENESSAALSQVTDMKANYRACPLSKKTPRELTEMFLNDSNHIANYGVKLKDLKINLVMVKIPSNHIDSDRPSTSQVSKLDNKISTDGPPQNKREKRKTETHDEMMDVEGKCESAKPIIQYNKLLETASSHCENHKKDWEMLNSHKKNKIREEEEKCESSKPIILQSEKLPDTSLYCDNHKKVLEILDSFKRNRIPEENNRKKKIILKVILNERTPEIVPLSHYMKIDKSNSVQVQGQNKEVDFTGGKECINEKGNAIVIHEERETDCKSIYDTIENKLPTALDTNQKDITISCKTQRNHSFEHREDSSDSVSILKKPGMHLQLFKEFNSETEDSLLGEFASNDSNTSLTCEQVSSNSLILKINRNKSKRGKKRKNICSTNIDKNKVAIIYDNEENTSSPRSTDNYDASNDVTHPDENINNTSHVAGLAVFDFKDESSCDTGLDSTYPKRHKLFDKKKDKKIKRKRKIATDDVDVQPKVLRSTRNKPNQLEETDEVSPDITGSETNNEETDFSKMGNLSTILNKDKLSSDELQTRLSVSKENTDDGINVLTSDSIKNIGSNSLWEKIHRCLNTTCRNVSTQVRFRQFNLYGEVSVEDADIVSSETGILSLNDVISALTKLRDT